MNSEEQHALVQYLRPGETLEWVGTPRGGIRFRRSDALIIPLTFVAGAATIYAAYTQWQTDAPVEVLAFSAIGVLVALYFMFGRFLFEMLVREDAVYGLTNDRALILSGLLGRSIRGVVLKGLSEITLEEHSDKRGTITFGRTGMTSGLSSFTPESTSSRQPAAPAFEMIENAANVYQLIQSIQRR